MPPYVQNVVDPPSPVGIALAVCTILTGSVNSQAILPALDNDFINYKFVVIP